MTISRHRLLMWKNLPDECRISWHEFKRVYAESNGKKETVLTRINKMKGRKQ